MIILTRLNGQKLALNPDLVERAEATPDTIVSLVSGAKHVVREGLDELAHLMLMHRSEVLRVSMESRSDSPVHATPALHVVSNERDY